MRTVTKNGLVVLQFEHEGFKGFIHGFLTRNGGVSKDQWRSLNQGSTVGDELENVLENRKRAFSFFERNANSIYDVWQVHSTDVVYAQAPRRPDEPHIKADGIFTDDPEVTLFMRFADCVPIILCDPKRKIAGIVHAGWKGTVNNIVGNAIKQMTEKMKIDPTDIIAGIGPSIGPDHYVVGEDVVQQVKKNFGKEESNLVSQQNGSYYLDLWAANEYLLRQSGVSSIESARICTACHTDDWYSHRKENGKTGRFGALLAIRKED